ncbi:MAG TPA: protein kinase [Pyrinomonadaceae bacterium]|nr:protein kinase [Pyrinomonadaceae bacterium]
MIPESIAHYRIIKKLGAGGMGEVYLAVDTKLDRKVAIKLIRADTLGEEQLKKRLIREAQAAAKLDHPNICSIYDVSEEGPLTFIVMQYIEGETLAESMVRDPLSLSSALAIVEQAAEGLAEAHAHGIVHRDIKPHNMMLTSRGQLKILDFGLAKQTLPSASVDNEAPTAELLSTPGHVVGTMPYMSPEQVQGQPLTPASDIFSLGIVFYEMLAGKHPFKDKSAAVTMSRILVGDPMPTEQFQTRVSPELQTLLSKMLSKDRATRYQNAQDFLKDLRKLQSSEATPATTPNRNVVASFLSKRAFVALGVGALALILAVIAINRWFSAERSESLAILPFTYSSSDPQLMANSDREYISDGMTESIINNLSQLTNLRVIARSSVFRYKGKDLDVQSIGRELNVRSVLVGQVKEDGDELRIGVELMDVQGNRSIWGDTYQRKTGDIQTVQKEIVRNVTEKLRLKLTGADQTQLTKTHTDNSEAYQAYLKGRYHWNKRTDESFKKAIDFFQEAIKKDPNYALAYTGLADCYTLRSDYGFLPSQEGYALAKGAVTLALKYDDSLAEAHTSLASIIAVTDWNWQGAENEYRRAIELNPNYPTAHHWYGAQLILQGRMAQAIQQLKIAQQLDPLSLGINKDLAVAFIYARDYDGALQQCQKTLEIEPTFLMMSTYMAQAYQLQQKYAEATAELEKAHAAAPDDAEITYGLGQAYALTGKKNEALKISNELSQSGKAFLPKEAAYLYSLLGEKEQAVAILQKAAENHIMAVAELKMDPRLDELRKDARIGELLRKIGLSQ